MHPAAQWFHDPQDPTRFRYWDGSAWTVHTRQGPEHPEEITPVPEGLPAPILSVAPTKVTEDEPVNQHPGDPAEQEPVEPADPAGSSRNKREYQATVYPVGSSEYNSEKVDSVDPIESVADTSSVDSIIAQAGIPQVRGPRPKYVVPHVEEESSSRRWRAIGAGLLVVSILAIVGFTQFDGGSEQPVASNAQSFGTPSSIQPSAAPPVKKPAQPKVKANDRIVVDIPVPFFSQKYESLRSFTVRFAARRIESVDSGNQKTCASLSAQDVETLRAFREYVLKEYKEQTVDFSPSVTDEQRIQQRRKISLSSQFIRIATTGNKTVTVFLDSFGKDERIASLLDVALRLFPVMRSC